MEEERKKEEDLISVYGPNIKSMVWAFATDMEPQQIASFKKAAESFGKKKLNASFGDEMGFELEEAKDFKEEDYINKEGIIYKILNEENTVKMESIYEGVL